MKKHLLLLAGLLILAPNGPADAKAVKLGRGSAYSVAADAKINTGAGAQMDTTKKCDSSCTTCDTTTGKCIGCPSGKRPDAARCVDNCYNVTCKDGYTTKVTSDGCCCESTTPTCTAGTYLSGSSCLSCFAGTYSAAGATSCTKCRAGTYSAAGASSCTTCKAGTYSAAGATSCTTCPTGYTSYAGSSGCTLCATGYTMIENTGKCVSLSLPVTSCPANTQDCGSTGCCPTTYSCSYYAEKGAGGIAMCYKMFEATTY